MEYYDISTSPGPGDWEEEEREINGLNEEEEESINVEEKFKHECFDPVLSSQVVAILNELGHYNRMTNTYQLNHRDAQSCLRDLIRFLRNDGNSFFVRRQMGVSNIVNNDLLPIIEQHTVDINTSNISQDGKLIMDKVIRLLVDLTNPTMLHYRDGKIPKNDKEEIPIYLQLQQTLYKYKIAFALRKRFWIVLAKHLTRILSLDEVDRELEDTHMFERIIILIRNVLHIIEDQSVKGTVIEGNNIHDQIVEHLHEYNILEILQYLISSNNFNDYCFHIIEIIFLIYREQSAEFIAKSITGDPLASENLLPEDRASLLLTAGRSDYEISIDKKEFEEARLRDKHLSIQMGNKLSRYGAGKYNCSTFIVKGMKSISDRDMICHEPSFDPSQIDLDKGKQSKTRARNRRLMEENIDNSDAFGVQRFQRSSRKIRLILAEFAKKFLSDCYNSFMKTVRQNLSRGSSQDHDETYYLWACQFFMEFNRFRPKVSHQDRFDCVRATVDGTIFHYIQTLVDNYLEHLEQKQFKNELGEWAKRLHCALRTYRELLFTLQEIDSFPIPEAKKLSHKIKSDLFTEQEYRELLWNLLKKYDEMKMSKAYLRDLIETNHLFLKMLEYHVKISYNFKVNVKRKSIKRTKKKMNKSNNDEPEIPKDPEAIWNEINERIIELLNSDSVGESNIIETTEELRKLFDPLSERSLEEQKLYLMRKVNYLLLEKDIERAISLFREARLSLLGVDVDNTFGEMDIIVEDEVIALKEILMTDFPNENSCKEHDENNDDEYNDDENNDDGNDDGNDDDEDEEMTKTNKEVYFNMDDTVRNYARPEIISAYRIMLKNFRNNKPETNHAIVRMLYRIAVDIKMTPMFFNLGCLNCFERILSDPILRCKDIGDSGKEYAKSIKELAQFAHFITRKFFKLLNKYPKIAAELCFIANSRDAYSMEYGYDDSRVGDKLKALKNKKKLLWTEEQELELEVLYKECQKKIDDGDVELKLPNGKKRDVVDLIQERLMEQGKTRRQIIAQLKKMELIQGKIRAKKPNSDIVVQYSSGEEDNCEIVLNDNELAEKRIGEFSNEEEEEEEEENEEEEEENEEEEKEEEEKEEEEKEEEEGEGKEKNEFSDVRNDMNKGKIKKKMKEKNIENKGKISNKRQFNFENFMRKDFELTFKKKSRAVIMDSDDEEGEKDIDKEEEKDIDKEEEEIDLDLENDQDSLQKFRGSLRIDDDDEEENDKDSIEYGNHENKINKRKRKISEDEENNEQNNDIVETLQPKRKRFLIFDDDDGGEKIENYGINEDEESVLIF